MPGSLDFFPTPSSHTLPHPASLAQPWITLVPPPPSHTTHSGSFSITGGKRYTFIYGQQSATDMKPKCLNILTATHPWRYTHSQVTPDAEQSKYGQSLSEPSMPAAPNLPSLTLTCTTFIETSCILCSLISSLLRQNELQSFPHTRDER